VCGSHWFCDQKKEKKKKHFFVTHFLANATLSLSLSDKVAGLENEFDGEYYEEPGKHCEWLHENNNKGGARFSLVYNTTARCWQMKDADKDAIR
jgi:hypothetical protein